MTDLEKQLESLVERVVERLRVVVREEIANANHSGSSSATGIAASGQEDPCDVLKEPESMDPTSTRTNGASTSLLTAEERGRRRMKLLERERKRTPAQPVLATKAKASR